MLSYIAIGVRAILLLFGIVVLGISVTLAKQQVIGAVPPETGFGSFAGAFGLITCAVGLGSLWIDKIPTILVVGADALASIFYLAGGIALTVALQSVSSCTSTDDTITYDRLTNKLLSGGCINKDGRLFCASMDNENEKGIGRCQSVQADYVFQFLGFIFGVGAIAIGWMIKKRGGGTTAAYV